MKNCHFVYDTRSEQSLKHEVIELKIQMGQYIPKKNFCQKVKLNVKRSNSMSKGHPQCCFDFKTIINIQGKKPEKFSIYKNVQTILSEKGGWVGGFPGSNRTAYL